jgi:hypothetical protein
VIIVANKMFDSAKVMRQLFGEREDLAYQTGHTLLQGIVEAFDVIGVPGFGHVLDLDFYCPPHHTDVLC